MWFLLFLMGFLALSTGFRGQSRGFRPPGHWRGLLGQTRLYARYHSHSSRRHLSTKFINTSGDKKKIVFLGTPSFAADCLNVLINRSHDAKSTYEIAAVVSQPPAPSGRSKKPVPSPVHTLAEANNITVFTPEKAKDETFLVSLASLQPDLCITAAYGNFLPSKFLSIPKFGTLNIHPSLLPLYRGAAPVLIRLLTLLRIFSQGNGWTRYKDAWRMGTRKQG